MTNRRLFLEQVAAALGLGALIPAAAMKAEASAVLDLSGMDWPPLEIAKVTDVVFVYTEYDSHMWPGTYFCRSMTVECCGMDMPMVFRYRMEPVRETAGRGRDDTVIVARCDSVRIVAAGRMRYGQYVDVEMDVASAIRDGDYVRFVSER